MVALLADIHSGAVRGSLAASHVSANGVYASRALEELEAPQADIIASMADWLVAARQSSVTLYQPWIDVSACSNLARRGRWINALGGEDLRRPAGPNWTLNLFDHDWVNVFVPVVRNRFEGASMTSHPQSITASSYRKQTGLHALWTKLSRSIDRWGELPLDWDGDDGVAPAKHTVCSAKEFLQELRLAHAPLPEGYVTGDGEIGFRWRKHAAFASAAFLDDGHFVGFIRTESNEPPLKIDVPFPFTVDRSLFLDRLNYFA